MAKVVLDVYRDGSLIIESDSLSAELAVIDVVDARDRWFELEEARKPPRQSLETLIVRSEG